MIPQLPKSRASARRLLKIGSQFTKLSMEIDPQELPFVESTFRLFMNHLIAALVRRETSAGRRKMKGKKK